MLKHTMGERQMRMMERLASTMVLISAFAFGLLQPRAGAALEAGTREVGSMEEAVPVAAVKTPASASPAGWVQEFPELRVEVVRLIADQRQVSVFLRYVNKTEEELYLTLDSPKGEGHSSRAVTENGSFMDMVNHASDKSYLLDHEGTRYKFMSASGLAGGWYGEACPNRCWEVGTTLLLVPPKETTTASLRFQVKKEPGRPAPIMRYHLVSGQILVLWPSGAAGDLTKARPGKRVDLSIGNIEPR